MARGKGRPFQTRNLGQPRRTTPARQERIVQVRDLVNEVHDENGGAIKAALSRVATSLGRPYSFRTSVPGSKRKLAKVRLRS